MFPLIKLAKKLKVAPQQASWPGSRSFPLIKLAKKLKAGDAVLRGPYISRVVFPLIKLAKKLKDFCSFGLCDFCRFH